MCITYNERGGTYIKHYYSIIKPHHDQYYQLYVANGSPSFGKKGRGGGMFMGV